MHRLRFRYLSTREYTIRAEPFPRNRNQHDRSSTGAANEKDGIGRRLSVVESPTDPGKVRSLGETG
jgi:hypothetical protein